MHALNIIAGGVERYAGQESSERRPTDRCRTVCCLTPTPRLTSSKPDPTEQELSGSLGLISPPWPLASFAQHCRRPSKTASHRDRPQLSDNRLDPNSRPHQTSALPQKNQTIRRPSLLRTSPTRTRRRTLTRTGLQPVDAIPSSTTPEALPPTFPDDSHILFRNRKPHSLTTTRSSPHWILSAFSRSRATWTSSRAARNITGGTSGIRRRRSVTSTRLNTTRRNTGRISTKAIERLKGITGARGTLRNQTATPIKSSLEYLASCVRAAL